MRPSGRANHELRPMTLIRQFTQHAEGSVLVTLGNTKVICTASIEPSVPRFLRDQGQGWITAEYGMLPRATHERTPREAAKGKQNGRTVEIQRLIGRALRACVDLKALGEHTITIDCDVIQADGGTRTASITGACVALVDALNFMRSHQLITRNPLKHWIAAISVGLYQGESIVDLDYTEDSNAEADVNIVMTESGQFVEIQGTGERATLTHAQLQQLLTLAETSIQQIIGLQKQTLTQT